MATRWFPDIPSSGGYFPDNEDDPLIVEAPQDDDWQNDPIFQRAEAFGQEMQGFLDTLPPEVPEEEPVFSADIPPEAEPTPRRAEPEPVVEPQDPFIIEEDVDRTDTTLLGIAAEKRRQNELLAEREIQGYEVQPDNEAMFAERLVQITSDANLSAQQMRAEAQRLATEVFGDASLAQRIQPVWDGKRGYEAVEEYHKKQGPYSQPTEIDWSSFGEKAEAGAEERDAVQITRQHLATGAANLRALQNSALSAIQEVMGIDASDANARAEYYQAVSRILPEGTKLDDIKSVGDGLAWAYQSVLEQAPMLATTISGAGAGAALIRGSIGAKIGAFGTSYALELGAIQQGNKELSPDEKAGLATFIGAGPAAALDAILPARIGTRLIEALGRADADKLALQALLAPSREFVQGAVTEGATEFGQTVIEEITSSIETGKDVPPGLLARAIEAAATGAVAGGTISAVSTGAERVLQQPASPRWFPEVAEARPIVRPIEQRSEPVREVAPTPQPVDTRGRAQTPLIPEGRITSRFGPRQSFRTLNGQMASSNHGGIDIALPMGAKAPAAVDGVVVSAGPRGGYGNTVIIKATDGTTFLYAHLSKIGVEVGDQVSRGMTLGRVGQSGNATGPHLHLERRDAKGRRVNPLTGGVVNTNRVQRTDEDGDAYYTYEDDTGWEAQDDIVDYKDTWDQGAIDETFERATGQRIVSEPEPGEQSREARRPIAEIASEILGQRDPTVLDRRLAELEQATSRARETLRQEMMATTALATPQPVALPPEAPVPGPIDLPAPAPEATGEQTFDYNQPLPGEQPVFAEDQETVTGFINEAGDYRPLGQPGSPASLDIIQGQPIEETATEPAVEQTAADLIIEDRPAELPQEVTDQLDRIEDKLFDLEVDGTKTQLRVYLKKLVNQGIIPQAELDALAPMFKDRDMGVEDITSEIRTSVNIWAENQAGQTRTEDFVAAPTPLATATTPVATESSAGRAQIPSPRPVDTGPQLTQIEEGTVDEQARQVREGRVGARQARGAKDPTAIVRARLSRAGRRKARPYTRAGGGVDRGVRGLIATYEPTPEERAWFEDAGYPAVTLHELRPTTANVKRFTDAINASKRASRFGAAVYVYTPGEYLGMRLFLTDDGKSGFALKTDGDIVSVFSDGGGKVHSILDLAVQLGGTKLDAFDTVLPDLYGISGFKEVRREPWNEEYAPEGWDKKTFADFNNGEPDVVWMEYDPTYNPLAEAGRGKFQIAPEAAPAPVYYSALEKAIENEPAKKAPWTHWMEVVGYRREGDNWVFKGGKGGVKKEEAEWIGVPEWLQAQGGIIFKEEVLNFVQAGGVQVKEVVATSPYDSQEDLEEAIRDEADRLRDQYIAAKLEDWDWEGRFDYEDSIREDWPPVVASTAGPLFSDTEAGGFEYNGNEYATEEEANDQRDKDIQAAVDEAETEARNDYEQMLEEDINAYEFENEARENLMEDGNMPQYMEYANEDGEQYTELKITLPPGVRGNPATDAPTHWNERGVVAHIRFKTREDSDGKKVLFLEEVQSDWHQRGRDKGYAKKLTAKEREELEEAQRKAMRKRADAGAALHARATKLLEEKLANTKPPEPVPQPVFDRTDTTGIGVSHFTSSLSHFDMALRRGELGTLGSIMAGLSAHSGKNVEALLEYAEAIKPNVEFASLQVAIDRLTPNTAPDLLTRHNLSDRAAHAIEDYNEARLRETEANQALSSALHGIPEAPFKNTWAVLAIKRAIRWAVDNKFDKVAWITGDLQNGGQYVRTAGTVDVTKVDDRYFIGTEYGNYNEYIAAKVQAIRQARLSQLGNKHVEALAKNKPVEEVEALEGQINRERSGLRNEGLTAEEVKAIFNTYSFKIGDEMVAKADEAKPNQSIEFNASKVGIYEDGHFFYDRMLPNEVNKLIKPWGAKVEPVHIPYLAPDRMPEGNRAREAEIEARMVVLAEVLRSSESDLLSHAYAVQGYTFDQALEMQLDNRRADLSRLENSGVTSESIRERIERNKQAIANLTDPAKVEEWRAAYEEYQAIKKERESLWEKHVVPGFTITDQMRQAAKGGFPLFQKGDETAKAKWKAARSTIERTIAAMHEVSEEMGGLGGRSDLTVQPIGVIDETTGFRGIPKGKTPAGFYWPHARVIYLAAQDFRWTTPRITFRHELIHWARDIRVFNDLDWAILKKWVKGDRALMEWAKRAYPDDFLENYYGAKTPEEKEEIRLEEAIAEGFGRWLGGRLDNRSPLPGQKIPKGIEKIFEKLREFFNRLRMAMAKRGITRAELKEAARLLDDFQTGKLLRAYDAKKIVDSAKKVGRTGKDIALSRALMSGEINAEEYWQAKVATPKQQTALHGGAYGIDKFDLSFIGTGEGATAWGWGLYFTDLQSVAEHYRDKLAGPIPAHRVRVDGKNFNEWLANTDPYLSNRMISLDVVDRLDSFLKANGKQKGWLEEARGQFEFENLWAQTEAKKAGQLVQLEHLEASLKDGLAVFDLLTTGQVEYKRAGLYKVEIPDNENLLNWEEKVQDQPPAVREALAKVKKALGEDHGAGRTVLEKRQAVWEEFEDWRGGEVISALYLFFSLDSTRKAKMAPEVRAAYESGDYQKATSLFLSSVGIPGHRYLDRDSRAKGTGSYNYVIYDDSKIEITGRFALVDQGPLSDPTIPNEGLWGRTHTAAMAILSKIERRDFDPTERLGDALTRILSQKYTPILRAEERAKDELGVEQLPLMERPSAWLAADERGYKLNYLSDNLVTPMAEEMVNRNVSNEELGLYLYARHAPFRNRKIAAINSEFNLTDKPGSGMSNSEAAQIIRDFETDGKLPDLEAVASYIDQMIEFGQQEMLDSGLMSEDDLAAWFKPEEFYVPLRGNESMEPDVEFDFYPTHSALRGKGGGISVFGKESPRALGRKSKADLEGIVANVITMSQVSADRAYRNKIGQTVLNLIRRVGDDNFAKIDRVKRVPVWNASKGVVEYQLQKRVVSDIDKLTTIFVKVDGQDHKITFNHLNPSAMRFVRAAKNLDMPQFNWFISAFNTGTRFWSAMQTTYNAEFVVRNASRDIQTALVNVHGIKDVDVKGMKRSISKNLISLKPLIAAGWGVGHKTGEGFANAKEWNKLYAEFEANGGKLNFNDVQPIEDALKALDKAQKRAARSNLNPVKWAEKLIHFIDLMNSSVENMTRLAAYKALRDRGVDAKTSAKIARELTVNFAQHGEAGPLLNSFYGFANASLVGNFRLGLSLVKNPRVIVGLMLLGFVSDMLNAWFDDDEWDRYSEDDKDYHWTILLPDGLTDKNIHVPIGYGINSLVTIGRKTSEILRGKKNRDGTKMSLGDALGDIGYSIANAWSPVQGRSLLNILSPSLADPFVDIFQNKNHWGSPIRPEQATREEQKVPYSQLAWERTSRFWKGIAEGMNSLTGGDEITPGKIDVSPEEIRHVATEWGGGAVRTAGRAINVAKAVGKAAAGDTAELKELGPNDYPFARAFVGRPYGAASTESEQLSAFYERYRMARVAAIELQKKEARYGKESEEYQSYKRDNEPILRFAMKKGDKPKSRIERAEDRVGKLNSGESAIKRLRDNPHLPKEAKKRARNAVFKATGKLLPNRQPTDKEVDEIRSIIRERRTKLARRFNEEWMQEVVH